MPNARPNTPYDDAFRTMLVDCIRLIIPVINEIFGTHYTGDEQIEIHHNEHFINHQDGNEDKRITDGSFTIYGYVVLTFLFECQSFTDNSLLIRVFEYMTQIGLDASTIQQNKLVVNLPNSAILFLRSTKNTPEEMEIEMNTPGGSVTFPVKVMKMKNYTLDEIFEKKLFFLLPFFIFTHEKEFANYEENSEAMEALSQEYTIMMNRLDEAVNADLITSFNHRTIIEMSRKVLDSIANKFEHVRKEVDQIMGGHVLDYPGRSDYYQGRRDERSDLQASIARDLSAEGKSPEYIANLVKAPLSQVEKWTSKNVANNGAIMT